MVILTLEQSFILNATEILEQARQTRTKIKDYYLIDQQLKKVKSVGRE